MKIFTTVLAIILTTSLFAQNETTWIGGTFGQEDAWDVASNWSQGDVPDEDSRVIIAFTHSGHHSQPLITGEVQVAAIEVHSLATLTVAEGATLIVDGTDTYSEGINCFGGSVKNNGEIRLQNLSVEPASETLYALQDEGVVKLDGHMQFYQKDPYNLTAKR